MRLKLLEKPLDELTKLSPAEEDPDVVALLDELQPLQTQRAELEPQYIAMWQIMESPYGPPPERRISRAETLTAQAEWESRVKPNISACS